MPRARRIDLPAGAVPEVDGPPAALLKSACDFGLEGVIGKRLGSPCDAVPHLRRRRRDPWADDRKTPQSLLAAMRKLGHPPASEKTQDPARRRAGAESRVPMQ